MLRLVFSCLFLLTTIQCHENPVTTQLVMGDRKEFTAQDVIDHEHRIDNATAHTKFSRVATRSPTTFWQGYDVVKEFKGKFDFVSPVWYGVRRFRGQYVLTDEQDVDKEWMDEVRGKDARGRKVGKIVPRFQMQDWDVKDYRAFVDMLREGRELTKLLLNQIKQVVRPFGHGVQDYPTAFGSVYKSLSKQLRPLGKQLIVVLPAVRMEAITKVHQAAVEYIEGGPTAFIDWVEDNVAYLSSPETRGKIMLGMHLYAMHYNPPHTSTALTMLQVVKRWSEPIETLDDDVHEDRAKRIILNWDEQAQEYWYGEMNDDEYTLGKVWIPSARAIKRRLQLAEDYDMGVAFWEVGQGLDYFYNVL
ncbi:hypothetical protein BC940DRAFT_329916 [Gongronella butleri]|nr:hypothetical protein BC940DRAFT_329916 [Gongronella butleri]